MPEKISIYFSVLAKGTVVTQGENDPYWNARMGYSCLMAYSSAATAYEYAKRWLALAPDDPDAQKLVRDCEEYLEEGNSLELDWNEREEIIRRETIPPADDDILGHVKVHIDQYFSQSRTSSWASGSSGARDSQHFAYS